RISVSCVMNVDCTHAARDERTDRSDSTASAESTNACASATVGGPLPGAAAAGVTLCGGSVTTVLSRDDAQANDVMTVSGIARWSRLRTVRALIGHTPRTRQSVRTRTASSHARAAR